MRGRSSGTVGNCSAKPWKWAVKIQTMKKYDLHDTKRPNEGASGTQPTGLNKNQEESEAMMTVSSYTIRERTRIGHQIMQTSR